MQFRPVTGRKQVPSGSVDSAAEACTADRLQLKPKINRSVRFYVAILHERFSVMNAQAEALVVVAKSDEIADPLVEFDIIAHAGIHRPFIRQLQGSLAPDFLL